MKSEVFKDGSWTSRLKSFVGEFGEWPEMGETGNGNATSDSSITA